MREVDDRDHDLAAVRIVGDRADERLVDLQLVDRIALQVDEARVARAEIIDDERDAEVFQLAQRLHCGLAMLHRGRLGHFELEPGRRQAGVLQRTRDDVHELWIGELPRRKIHADRQAARDGAQRAPAADRAEHPVADAQDEAGVLGELDEFRGRDQAARAMLPAQQPLVSDDASGRDLDDRLVEHPQLLVLQRAAQVVLELHAARRREVHLLGEELVVGAPRFLRVVHRRVGVADQRLRVAPVVREDADADGGRNLQVALVHRHRLRHRLDDLLRDVR